jgi:transcriptional regulator with XRE-family HTH domain
MAKNLLFADKIRLARKSADMSQYVLADKIGVSDKTISAYESARAIPPTQILKAIAQATNRPVSFFFETEAEAKEKNNNELEKLFNEVHQIRKILEKLLKEKIK